MERDRSEIFRLFKVFARLPLRIRLTILTLAISVPLVIALAALIALRAGMQGGAFHDFRWLTATALVSGAAALAMLAWLTIRQALYPMAVPTDTATAGVAVNEGPSQQVSERKLADAALQETNLKLTDKVQELEWLNQAIGALNELSALLYSCTRVEDTYEIIAGQCRQIFAEAIGGLYLGDPRQSALEAKLSWGNERLAGTLTPEDCWGLRRGRTHLGQAGKGVRCLHGRDGSPAMTLCLPLLAQSESLGVLHLQCGPADPARLAAVQQLSQAVADVIGLALTALNLRETLRQQSIRDPLTGLFNRRYMTETLEREVRRVERHYRPLSVLMLDLDHFKRFNDTFGHEVGDLVLRRVSELLLSLSRTSDVACRYGGEEFILILPDMALEMARQRAEQLRQGAFMLDLRHNGQALGTVTLSIGVAAFPEHGASGQALLQAAEAALYRAKQGGRNRIAVAE